jgi:hypothetical protein
LPPTTQSSTRPIATISHVPHRGDFVSAWAYRRASLFLSLLNPLNARATTTSWPQRLLPQSNVTSDALNVEMGPNPLRPELPVRETKWPCRPMEVTPAPPPNCPLETVRSCCSVPTAAPPKPSRVPRRDASLTQHRHRLLQHRCLTIAPLRRLPRAVSLTHQVPRPPLTRVTPPACNQ